MARTNEFISRADSIRVSVDDFAAPLNQIEAEFTRTVARGNLPGYGKDDFELILQAWWTHAAESGADQEQRNFIVHAVRRVQERSLRMQISIGQMEIMHRTNRIVELARPALNEQQVGRIDGELGEILAIMKNEYRSQKIDRIYRNLGIGFGALGLVPYISPLKRWIVKSRFSNRQQ